jgi:hypothetical protein
MDPISDPGDGLALLKEFNQSESLIKHALAVEAVSVTLPQARADEEKWESSTVHDLTTKVPGPALPQDRGDPARAQLARRAHPRGSQPRLGHLLEVKPESDLEKVLYAVDELTGLVRHRPWCGHRKSVLDMEASSVKKKWKDKRFAAGVDRSIIERAPHARHGPHRPDHRDHFRHAHGGRRNRPQRSPAS